MHGTLTFLMDYVYSFWVIDKVDPDHPNMAALAHAGIIKICSCPQFAHYFQCKHAVGYAIYLNEQAPPVAYNTATVGKRKAPEGPKPNKRAHCLQIEA